MTNKEEMRELIVNRDTNGTCESGPVLDVIQQLADGESLAEMYEEVFGRPAARWVQVTQILAPGFKTGFGYTGVNLEEAAKSFEDRFGFQPVAVMSKENPGDALPWVANWPSKGTLVLR
jgi:hypothetical protein